MRSSTKGKYLNSSGTEIEALYVDDVVDSVNSTSTTKPASANSIKTLNDAIANEKTARENADTTLTNNLNAEITRATNAEATKQDKLTAGTGISITNNVLSCTYTYTLPTASTSVLGGVKVDGTTIKISNGVISGASTYTLPTASTSVLGGVKVDGTTITINNGVISATPASSVTYTVTNGILYITTN